MKQHFIFPAQSGFYIHLVQNLQIIRQLSICIFFATNCKFPEQDHFWLPITLPNRFRILRVHIFWVRIPLCIKLESDYSRSTFESKWVQSCKCDCLLWYRGYQVHFIQVRFQDHSWETFTSETPISMHDWGFFVEKYSFAIGHCSSFSFYIKKGRFVSGIKFFTLFCWQKQQISSL